MRILPIKNSSEFKLIGKVGKKFYCENIIVLAASHKRLFSESKQKDISKDIDSASITASDYCKVGYTVSKSVSKLSTKRNLVKRRLREAFRCFALNQAKPGYHYVVIAKHKILESDFTKIKDDLTLCLTRIHSGGHLQSNKS